jgi:hypothetical protein
MLDEPQFDFSQFIGKKWGTEVTEEQVKKFCGAEMIRVLKPTSPMTMDLRPYRPNVCIEEDETIVNMNMG